MLCSVLLEGELGGKCFVYLVVKLEWTNQRRLKWPTKTVAHL
jgi:hypothetical protein